EVAFECRSQEHRHQTVADQQLLQMHGVRPGWWAGTAPEQDRDADGLSRATDRYRRTHYYRRSPPAARSAPRPGAAVWEHPRAAPWFHPFGSAVPGPSMHA